MRVPSETRTMEIGPHRVDVTVRHSPRARRISLKMDPQPGKVILVAPAHTHPRIAWGFLHENKVWLAERLERQEPPVPFTDGAEIPFRGQPHRVVHQASARGVVERNDDTLCVPGHPEHLARRLTDWLKRSAKSALTEAAARHAAAFDRKPARVTIRDPKSRWGSCSAAGNLSFSWRLILAPPEILDYVAAHEAAHLVELNHSPAYWKLVGSRIADPASANRWLREHGPGLHRYGAVQV